MTGSKSLRTHKIVLGFEPSEDLLDRVRKTLPGVDLNIVLASDIDSLKLALRGADVLWGGEEHLSALLDRASSLRWVQAISTGVENFVSPELLESGIVVTNARGSQAPQIAEHVLALILAFARDLPRLIRAQDRHRWVEADAVSNMFELDGKVLGVCGLGLLGGTLATKAKPLGMTVLATKKRPTSRPVNVDEIFGPNDLDEVLARSDFVVDTLPLTPLTRGAFALAQFRRMKNSAYFFNVGRGGTVVHDDLLVALQTGEIAGAGLDVTDPEPLPQDSKLWSLPNVIITSHTSFGSPYLWERRYRIFLDNLVRYHEQQPLANVVDLRAGY